MLHVSDILFTEWETSVWLSGARKLSRWIGIWTSRLVTLVHRAVPSCKVQVKGISIFQNPDKTDDEELIPFLSMCKVNQAYAMHIEKSCSIFVNNRLRCIHDGSWKECDMGHEPGDFERIIKQEFDEINQ